MLSSRLLAIVSNFFFVFVVIVVVLVRLTFFTHQSTLVAVLTVCPNFKIFEFYPIQVLRDLAPKYFVSLSLSFPAVVALAADLVACF